MPHRYIDKATIIFMDGSAQEVVGNQERIQDGVLIISTDGSGGVRDIHRFVLANIKSWTWEKE